MPLQNPEMNSSIKQNDEVRLLGYPGGDKVTDEERINTLMHSDFPGTIASLNPKNGYDRIYLAMQGIQGCSGGCIISKTTNEVIGVFKGAEIIGTEHKEDYNYAIPIKYVWQEFIKLGSV